MAWLDVSEVLTDPDFIDPVVVTRNQQTVDAHGRAQITPTTINIIAVVTVGSPDFLQRAADFEAGKNAITLHTQATLIGPSSGTPDYQPDIITWQDSKYVVRKIYPWSNYGQGFVAVDCEMLDLTGKSPI